MRKKKEPEEENRDARRDFIKKSGFIGGGIALGIPVVSESVQADNIGGGGSPSIEITS